MTIGELEVPESLRLVLGRRLDRLGDNGRRALAAAAVVGRAFTYELLEALGELAADALLDALEESQRARLVAPLSDSPDEDRLLFSHELIRQTLLAGLSRPGAGACTYSWPTHLNGSTPPPWMSRRRRSPTTWPKRARPLTADGC